ncbi:MAG: nucleotidyltransferase domain-containing protein [Candidatus Aenigmarchaeota archaeon]|nr:nucleotidyltransferase domain-containing protein [Candidatus Aenigmarchaeota archaeon]
MFNKLALLRLFLEQPSREFSVREASRAVRIAPATASKKLKEYTKKGILKERKERVLKLYKADVESCSYTDLKIYYNMRKIRESGLLEAINRFYLKPAVVLFGSASSGMDTETSDFDLVVISEKTAEFPGLKAFEKKINRRLQLFAVKDIREVKNEHLINNILNGIVLQGRIRWT